MTKGEARLELDVDTETFNNILKSCSFTEVKVFDCVKMGVMKKYMRLAKIMPNAQKQDKPAIIVTKVEEDSCEIITDISYFKISRKELIEVIAAAYNRGFKDSKNTLPVLTKNIINELIDEVAIKEEARDESVN